MRFMTHENSRCLSPEEFLDFAEREIDLLDVDSVSAAAEQLQGLANNRAHLLDTINVGLRKLSEREVLSASSATLLLGRCRNKAWFIRANLWPAIRMESSALERSTFSYDGVHDHNFSFLTANYCGPGYETDVWINRGANSEGHQIGDSVDLQFQGRFRLAPSTQMFYEHGRDVHRQIPPREFTVSLNLMFNDPEVRLRPQHGFDAATGRVIDRPAGTMSMRRVQLVRMAARIGNSNTMDVLDWLAQSSPCRETRSASALAVETLRERL